MQLPDFSKIKAIVLDMLFPPLCLACRRALQHQEKSAALCGACFTSVPFYDTLTCGECGSRLPNNAKTCHKDVPYLLAAATRYSETAPQRLIRQLKYRRLRAAATPLAAILNQYIDNLNFDFSAYTVMPIPLHPKRLAERGFNQAELLAAGVASRLQIPLIANALRRIKNNVPQAKIAERARRRENIKNCFSVADGNAVSGKQILLIDDVHTSGATVSEASRVLRAAGAKKIIALVVARTN